MRIGVAWGLGTLHSNGPRLVLQESLDHVAAQFGGTCESFAPRLAANRQRQLLVSFCDGVLAAFESHLPIQVCTASTSDCERCRATTLSELARACESFLECVWC
jgi:hypothetical protein